MPKSATTSFEFERNIIYTALAKLLGVERMGASGIVKQSKVISWAGYPIAVAAAALATWLQYLAQPTIIPSDAPILYFLAIVPTAIFFGLGPAILCCLFSILAYDYFFIPPLHTIASIPTVSDIPILIIFLLIGVTVSVLAAKTRQERIAALKEVVVRRQAQAELVKHRLGLENIVAERTSELQKANLDLSTELAERKILEDNLREVDEKLHNSEVRYRRLFETAQDAILILNGDTGRIIDANPFIKDLLGYSLVELQGKRLWEIGEFKDILASKLSSKQLQDNGYVRYEHLPLVTKDGRGIDVEIVANMYQVDHDRVIQCNIRDITERKKLERIKDDFIGMVSHELRTPVTIIIGALSTALDKRISVEDARTLLEDALSAGENLSSIIENLLELARAQSNQLNVRKESFEISDPIKRVVKRLIHVSPIHKAVVDIPDRLPKVKSDEVRIERILNNLVENAVKYSPNGGEINIFVRGNDEQLTIGVKDNGIGISSSDQARIFLPFERVNPNAPIKGAGLGLNVCRRLVEALGGTIWVESEVGKGSTFFFTVPAKNE